MIHCLVGKSASGKSTIERKLEDLDIPRIVSYTTREPRDGEVDGVDYYFIDDSTFARMLEEGKFSEHAQYREWQYGLSLEGVDYIHHHYIAVVTPKGYRELTKSVGAKWVNAYFVHVPERERMIRQLNRGDDVDEVVRRLYTDRVDFDGFVDEADITFNNKDLDKVLGYIYTLIKC